MGERSSAQSGERWLLLPLALLLFACVVVPLRILETEGLPRYRLLREELRKTEDGNARLRREVEALRQRVDSLRQDPSAIERLARDEIGMLRRDELVFQFDD
jgi:cell division protein FtsB